MLDHTPKMIEADEIPEPDVTSDPFTTIEQMATDALVAKAREGDRDAYAMLFHRFHDEIYRFAARRLADPYAGQEAAAETFADAFGAIRRFQWKGVPFEAWLYTIARRRVADLQRAQSRREVAGAAFIRPDVVDHSGSIVDLMHMRALIARLGPVERDVIELRFMEDLDVEQTALRLGKMPGAVRVAQHRALSKLRAMIQEGVA